MTALACACAAACEDISLAACAAAELPPIGMFVGLKGEGWTFACQSEFYDLKKIAQGRQRKLLCKIKNIYEYVGSNVLPGFKKGKTFHTEEKYTLKQCQETRVQLGMNISKK